MSGMHTTNQGWMNLKLKLDGDSVAKEYSKKVGHSGDAGFDLYFPEDVVVPSKDKVLVSTKGKTGAVLIDLKVACEMEWSNSNFAFSPSSYYLVPRSSISKTPLQLINSVGIIDRGYRGNLKVALLNYSNEDYFIKKGDRLFQIVGPNLNSTVNDVEIVDKLSETDRGAGGYGSTGGHSSKII